jgi:DNA-binding NarL/FixJ family response regulator
MSLHRIGVLCQELGYTKVLLDVLGSAGMDVLAFGGVPSRALLAGSSFDILLLDGRIPGALDLCQHFRDRDHPRVVLVAGRRDDVWGTEAISAGAWGIVYRRAPAESILEAIAAVRQGLVWAPRNLIAAAMVGHLKIASHDDAAPKTELDSLLSSREREVFRHAALGLGNRELADLLAISEATVKAHLTHIFQKLGIRRRAQLAAAYHGIFPASVDRSKRPLPRPA